jgi:putative phosphoesterase
MRIAIIADTHGYLDQRVPPAIDGAGLILHAGDIGAESILTELARIAPVTAVAGNNDGPLDYLGLPIHVDLRVEGAAIHLVHRLIDAAPPPATNVVVFGHSHKALIEDRDGVLYINPGAAGRRGFHREITAALLEMSPDGCRAEIVHLGPRLPAR